MSMLHALEAPFAEQGSEVLLTYSTHEAWVALAQLFVYLGSREQQGSFPLARLTEVLAAMLLHGRYVAISAVAQFDVYDLLGSKVIPLATVQ